MMMMMKRQFERMSLDMGTPSILVYQFECVFPIEFTLDLIIEVLWTII